MYVKDYNNKMRKLAYGDMVELTFTIPKRAVEKVNAYIAAVMMEYNIEKSKVMAMHGIRSFDDDQSAAQMQPTPTVERPSFLPLETLVKPVGSPAATSVGSPAATSVGSPRPAFLQTPPAESVGSPPLAFIQFPPAEVQP